MHDLFRKYEERAVDAQDVLLLRFADAEQFLEDCKSEGLVVLRMDFYRQEGDSIRPTLLWADLYEFSEIPGGARLAATAALEILRSTMPNGESLVSFENVVSEKEK